MNSVTTTPDSPAPNALAAHDAAIPLQHVDSLATHTTANIGDAKVTGMAQQLLNYDPEAMVWQDSPNLSLMLSSVIKWALIVLVWAAVLVLLAPRTTPQPEAAQQAQVEKTEEQPAHGKKSSRKDKAAKSDSASRDAAAEPAAPTDSAEHPWRPFIKWIGLLVIAYQVYAHLVWALRLKCIKYKMSSQRLIVQSGIFSKTTNTYELHQLQAGQVQSPFFLRLCGCANLYVGVWLIGIRNAEAVRDLIRNAGQIEASRMDKARWR